MTVEPLSVHARLSLVNDSGGRMRVTADGATVTVALSSLRVALPYRRALDRRRRRALLQDAHAWLSHADLRVEFRVADHVVALLGPGARPGLFSRLFGLQPLELRTGAALLSLLRSA